MGETDVSIEISGVKRCNGGVLILGCKSGRKWLGYGICRLGFGV